MLSTIRVLAIVTEDFLVVWITNLDTNTLSDLDGRLVRSLAQLNDNTDTLVATDLLMLRLKFIR